MRWRTWICLLSLHGSFVRASDMQLIPGGSFMPFYTNDGPAQVADFLLDTYPVTNREFLEFVKANPEWQRSRVPSLFADDHYLEHWVGDEDLGTNAPPESPVTFVSWFAARAYAGWTGKRLPTLTEWEYAGGSLPANTATNDHRSIAEQVLAWYSRPLHFPIPAKGTTFVNRLGIWDLHGLIWEWVDDFNSYPVSERSDSGNEPNARNFCGGGSVGISDISNYAAFMRYAFRSSLQARYTVATLGFRCARSP